MMPDAFILLRLCAAPSPMGLGETRARVTADLRPLWPERGPGTDGRPGPGWPENFAASVARLAEIGHLSVAGRGGGRLRLTAEGGAEARRLFNLPEDAGTGPAGGDGGRGGRRRAGWAFWRDRYALPLALDTPHLGEGADGLRAALLRHLLLPDSRGAGDLRGAVDQLLARSLKTARVSLPEFRLAAVRGWLTARAAEAERFADDPGEREFPRDAPALPPAGLPGDLPAFAALVRETARGVPTGRFGERKIFIVHVWRALLAGGRAGAGEEAVFKERLVRAHTAGLLGLARADLTGAFDPADVSGSEVHFHHAAFHFLRLD